MANPQRAEVSVVLNGQPYTLKFDFNAICEAEEEMGGPVLKKEMGLRELRALVWAGLGAQNGQRRPTVQQVGSMFKRFQDFSAIQEKVTQALEHFMGEEEEKPETAEASAPEGEV